MMSKLFACPLTGGKINSDFCLEIQACVDGITEPTIQTEEFLEIEPAPVFAAMQVSSLNT